MGMINIKLSKAELLFMKEAMQEKFNGWMEELDDAQENSRPSTFTLNTQQVQAMKDAGMWKTAPPVVEKHKKPHWTQTPEGKKIMAKRRPRGSKK